MPVAVERRQHRRSVVKGSVRIQSSEYSQTARIANVSAGGVLVLTNVTAPEQLLRRVIDVALRLDAGDAEWIATRGEIVRVRPESVAIAFVEPSARLVPVLDEVETAANAHSRVISVILIDENTERCSALATGFASAGCSVIAAATPLEAIVRLGEARFEPDVVAIADSLPAVAANEMREFVEREHPRAKLVTIGDELTRPDSLVHWLSSTDPEGDLARRVRDVLVAPQRRR